MNAVSNARRLASTVGILGALTVLASTPAVAQSATDLLADESGAVQYALVFLFAAIPWFEILLVIPVGIGLGMNAAGVAVFAFLGNVLPIYAIIAAHRRVTEWWEGRHDSDGESDRQGRARAIWDRYGLPGLAIASPIVTGVHLAAVIALALGSGRRAVGIWLTASIALWTAILTIASHFGFDFLSGLG